jgi:hypothetical protein
VEVITAVNWADKKSVSNIPPLNAFHGLSCSFNSLLLCRPENEPENVQREMEELREGEKGMP